MAGKPTRTVLHAANASPDELAWPEAATKPVDTYLEQSPRDCTERGATLAAMGAWRGALQALRRATTLDAHSPEAWRRLAIVLRLCNDDAAAAQAESQAARAAQPPAERAPKTQSAGKLAAAERKLRDAIAYNPAMRPAAVLRESLVASPCNVAALRLLAETWGTQQPPETIEQLLLRALELAPDYEAARRDYVNVLLSQSKWPESLPHIAKLLAAAPRDPAYLLLHAETLTAVGHTWAALDVFETVIRRVPPRDVKFWLAYARALKDAGRKAESAQAWRTAIQCAPANGAAYWGLADLKSVPLTDAEIATIRQLLADPRMPAADRALLHYANGAMLERQKDFAGSFAEFAQAASLRRAAIAGTALEYDPNALTEQVRRLQAVFTRAVFTRHGRAGAHSLKPIFIVGMPRSGSTLIEQILASHSQVEGTQELPELSHIVRALDVARRAVTSSNYPECLEAMSTAELAALGAEYLARTAIYRKTGKPYFIDKLPGNWLHAGLIHLILPDAIIVDARRHPMACGFAIFKQLLVGGANYSYDLGHIGHRTRTYVQFLQHLERELPGRIHRVQYEALVQDTEVEIRRLLAHCGLPFEAACLEFWKTDRVVRTPSAEQVRQPIFRDALEQWRNYEPLLGELRKQAILS